MKNLCVGLSVALIASASTLFGQTTVDIPDTYVASITNKYSVESGSIISTNGVLIVFEGRLSIDTNITATADGSGRVLAATQLEVKMALFSDLPDVDSFTNSQAAVLAVFNSGSDTEGTLYGLNMVGGVSSWVQLTNNVTSTPMAVTVDSTNLVTIILRYPDGGSYDAHEYTVSLSTREEPDQITSQVLSSPITTESGIKGMSVVGEGALRSSANTSGDPAPLSSRVDFSVYQTTNGVFVADLYTVDENGDGLLQVYALIDGQWVLIGSVSAEGGSNHYQFPVTGLVLGESYLFKVVDEEGRTHLSNGLITVKSIVMQAVQLELDKFQIQFNSEADKLYKLAVSSDMKNWVYEDVEVYAGGSWVAFDADEGFIALSNITVIRAPRNRDKAFFRVVLIQEDAGSMNMQ